MPGPGFRNDPRDHLYEKHGFRKVTPEEKDHLLRKYWDIPDRQIETSVVLVDEHWKGVRELQ